jgi:hypothetical protein
MVGRLLAVSLTTLNLQLIAALLNVLRQKHDC